MQRLQLKCDDTLLIRGASCALGFAAIQMAKALGCKIIATTYRDKHLHLLQEGGADESVLDDGEIAGKICGATKALELIGCKTLFDTMRSVEPGGIICHTGVLMRSVEPGGIICHTGVLGNVFAFQRFSPLNHIPNGVYLTGFHSNDPTDDDLRDIFSFLDKHNLKPLTGAVYRFDDIRQALIDLDGHKVQGKIVICME